MSGTAVRSWPGALFLTACAPLCVLAQYEAPIVEGNPPSVEARLGRLERLLTNRGMLDLLDQVERLHQEVKRLRGEMEVQAHRLEKSEERDERLYSDLDRRLQALETGASGASDPGDAHNESTSSEVTSPPRAVEPAASRPLDDSNRPVETPVDTPAHDIGEAPSSGPAPGQATSGVAPDTGTPVTVAAARASHEEDDYRRAFDLLKVGNYNDSISAFNNFIAQYPKSAHADNAQYWLAEAYYVTHQYQPAISEYTKLIERYPESQKLTHALLKIGYSHHELGQLDQASTSLESLRVRYPGTTAARLADERLQRIRLEKP
ncbi:MAG: tol-pal system protein YbgF [Gammaproteobacteria bacterium]|nr:tol-pal system protein YbgF [Gammaproteobacteria bacterium]